MTGPTHELIGVTAALGLGYATSLPALTTALLAAGSYAASRLPDRAELGILPHRGVTHSLPMLLLVALVALVVALAAPFPAGAVAAGVLVGWLMHLVADGCTITGIPGWPLRRRVWLLPRRLRLVTGGRWRRR